MRFLKNKLIAFALALLALSGGLFLYGQITGAPSPAADLIGSLTAPVQHLFAGAADKLGDLLGYFHKYDDLEAENRALREELYDLRQLAEEYYAAVNENKHLRALAGLTEKHTDFTWELANITARPVGGYQNGFSIDRGTKHGVEQGDPVMTDAGLVGFVSSVGYNYAEVTTLVSLDFKAGALVSRTREIVVAEGSFELAADNRLRLSYLANNMDLQPGDLIETSGSGGLFPRGLVIGTVEQVGLELSGISSYAVVKPAVDFDQITAVFVVKDFQVVD